MTSINISSREQIEWPKHHHKGRLKMLSGSLYFDGEKIIKCSISLLVIFIFPEEKGVYGWNLIAFILPWREGRRVLVTPLPFHPNLQLHVNRPFLWYSSCHGKAYLNPCYPNPFSFCFSFPSLSYKMSAISDFCFIFENGKKWLQMKKPLSFVQSFEHMQSATCCNFWNHSCLVMRCRPVSPFTYVITYG